MKERIKLKKKGIELVGLWFKVDDASNYGIFLDDDYLILEGSGEPERKDKNGQKILVLLENGNELCASFQQMKLNGEQYAELKPKIIERKKIKRAA